MAKIELTNKMNKDWEDSLDVSFLSNNKELTGQLYTFFRQYDNGDETKKIELITSMIENIAKAMDIKLRKIKVYNNPASKSSGSYLASEKQLNVNLVSRNGNYLFSAQIITTILHELRHAYQDQHLMNIKSDFGRLIKHDTENYIQPSDNNMMQDIGYITNFIEVDAQRFSYKASKALVNEVIKNNQNQGRIIKKILEVKLRDIVFQEKMFESSYSESIKVLNNSDNIIESIKEHFINTCIAFYKSKFDTPEEEKLHANLISDSLEQFVNIRENKTIIKPTMADIQDLYITTLSSVNPKDVVEKLNNSMSMLFYKIGYDLRFYSNLNMKKGDHLISYNGYLPKLKEGVEFGKIFLDKFEIQYKDDNNGSIYEKYSKTVFDYLAEAFSKPETDEFDKMLAENILSLELRDPERFGRDKLIAKISDLYKPNDIKKILEQSIDNNLTNAIIRTFSLDKYLLKGYAYKYTSEKNNGTFSRFLDHYNIKYDAQNFSDIFDKFNSAYPKFIAECLGKKEFSDIEQEFLSFSYSIATKDSISPEDYIKAVEKMYSKTKLKAIYEDKESNNPAIDYLIQKDIKLEDFHNKKTIENTNISEKS